MIAGVLVAEVAGATTAAGAEEDFQGTAAKVEPTRHVVAGGHLAAFWATTEGVELRVLWVKGEMEGLLIPIIVYQLLERLLVVLVVGKLVTLDLREGVAQVVAEEVELPMLEAWWTARHLPASAPRRVK
jgi:hypothetical protein